MFEHFNIAFNRYVYRSFYC